MNTLEKQTESAWISGTEAYFNKAFEILNHYPTYRKKYIVQNDGEGYRTVEATLCDWNLEQHIKGIKTYGIFVDKISKFLTFDIDLKVQGKEYKHYNKWILYKVIDALKQEGLWKYMNISYSGSKGYHIDLIFDKPVKTAVLKEFGECVIKKHGLDNITVDGKLIAQVELRGCNGQPVKLPLGLHRKTQNYMYYLNENLEPVGAEELLDFDLKILDAEEFYNIYARIIDACVDDIDKFKGKERAGKAIGEADPLSKEANTKLNYDKSELDFVVQNEILKNHGSRNNMIYLVALWSNGHKLSKQDALDKLDRIIYNTPEQLFHDNTSDKWKQEQNKSVIEKVYGNNLVLFDEKKVGLNKAMLEWIMQTCKGKTLKQMNILLCHIYHCLKWGNEEGMYFLSESTIEQYTGATNKTVEKLNKQLIDLGILEVVEQGRYIDLGAGMKKGIATTYKLAIPHELIKDVEFFIKSDKIDFVKMCTRHLDKRTILKYIPKQTYSDNF